MDDLYNAVHLVLQTVSKSPPLTSGPTGSPSFDYIEQTILRSDPQEGWERVSDSVSSLGISRTDVNLRLVMKFTAEGVQRDNFKAEWANRHPDPSATGYWCDIYYCSTHVFRTILVSVDGGRAFLPVPRQQGVDGEMTEVLMYDYRIAQIFDALGTLDEYMRRSGLYLAFR